MVSLSMAAGNIFTGFSVGVSGNLGYAFAKSPQDLYRDIRFPTSDTESFQIGSITLGAGLQGRIHLIDHLHVGAEGYISTMPMRRSENNIRHGYAGALIDGYLTLGKVVLCVGTGLGGGRVKRSYVLPKDEWDSAPIGPNGIRYNAYYQATPFFYLDPYLGLEVHFNKLMGMNIRVDYMLPFNATNKGFGESITWSGLISPTGPRLHLGFLIGALESHQSKDKNQKSKDN